MESCRFLRPALSKRSARAVQPAHARFFAAFRTLQASHDQTGEKSASSGLGDHARRVHLLRERKGLDNCYPRLSKGRGTAWSGDRSEVRAQQLNEVAEQLGNGESTGPLVSLDGRVLEVRALSSKLMFLSCIQNGVEFQIVCNRNRMGDSQQVLDSFKEFRGVVRRGDWISSSGICYKSEKGHPALLAMTVPTLAAPSLHQIPQTLNDTEMKARRPHVGMLVDKDVLSTMQIRSKVEVTMIEAFSKRGFAKVSTPILSSQAGGAMARSFETIATELSATKLHLRIAPELWLKRLLVGGMDKIFEIGPAFRNEGVDNTHNPEFTMCEAYQPFTTLDELMAMTDELLALVTASVSNISQSAPDSMTRFFSADCLSKDDNVYNGRIKVLPFVPTLEEQMQDNLPDLSSTTARNDVLRLFEKHDLAIPERATLPALLDALCGIYIEPLCREPTFITYPPAPLSPLSKTFRCSSTGQIISARAELFIEGREYANTYEEENSPFEQRKKFEQQIAYRKEVDPDFRGEVDESYLEALEWGLPPTGGWGMGIDRLVMLLSGKQRIGDVLPFGTLRNVVGLQQVDKRNKDKQN